jgi:arylsulfatase A-like enzyme
VNKLTRNVAAFLALCKVASSPDAVVAQDQTPKSDRAEARPNVLFIVADDLGWRDTGVYGSTYYRTPNIDALAKSGIRFTDACAASPLCSPTRASIMLGQYPMRHGLTTASGHIAGKREHEQRTTGPEEIRAAGPSSQNYLDPKHYTLGEAMKDAGYATGFFGKWHMGHNAKYYPENHGFDHVKGGRHHPGPPGKNPGRKFFPPWNCDTLDSNIPADTHVDDYLADLAIDYMKQQREDGKPFFVCYWAYSVHAPYQSKPALVEKWKRGEIDRTNPQHAPTMGAMIEVLDDNVGRLMKALEDQGLAENTIVIFTSDNGGNMYDTVDGTTPTNNAPLRVGKGNNYEGGVRVPLIVRWPGVTKPGMVSDSLVSSVDHFPAILEMTGQKQRPDDHKDGVSYVPALRGEPFDRGPTVCDFPHPVWATYNIPNVSIRMGQWKMYRFWFDDPKNQTHRYELYDLAGDIRETKDLAASNPAQFKKMIDALDGYCERTGVLTANPNAKYNNRTVGTWYATSDNGTVAARDGSLVIRADKPGFEIRNRFFPRTDRGGYMVFEARSTTDTPLRLAGPGQGKVLRLTEGWKEYEVSGSSVFLDRNRFAATLTRPGAVEIRNARILTKDKTVEMTRYRFY